MTTCVFCQIAAGHLPAAKVYEDDVVLAFFDEAPVADYHTLVIPKRHAQDIFEISEEDMRALAATVRSLALLYRDKLALTDLQILSSNGRNAQQEVCHFHVHIVPRFEGDGHDIAWTPDLSKRDRFRDWLARLTGPAS